MTNILAAMQGKRVLILGDAMLDRYVYGRVTRTSPESDCNVFVPTRKVEFPGGAANVRANVLSLGGIAQLISPPERSIKTRFVIDETNEHVLRVDEDRSEADIAPMVVESILTKFVNALVHHDIVVLSDYAKGCLKDDVLLPAIRMARDRKKPVIVDPKRRDWAGYVGASIITPNAKEFSVAVTAGAGDSIVETCGSDGANVYENAMVTGFQKFDVIKGHCVPNPDVTGAGDTFVAALALAVAAGASLYEAASIANAAAAVAVSKRGTACVYPDEVQRMLA